MEDFVEKLQAGNFQPIYTALLSGDCGAKPAGLIVDSNGAPAVAVVAQHDFSGASAVFRLTPDGQALAFSTYLSNCGASAIAQAPYGSIYAAVSNNGDAGVLDIPAPSVTSPGSRSRAPNLRPLALEALVNSFSGSAALAPGMFLTLEGENFGPFWIDEELNSAQDLPTELGGVQVLFDGMPAPILQVRNDGLSPTLWLNSRVICVVPSNLSGAPNIQISYNGVLSNAATMPVSSAFPGLLARSFPELPPNDGSADANVYNEDGTPNDARHPARGGSVVTLFPTGLGVASPPLPDGALATSFAPGLPVAVSFADQPNEFRNLSTFASTMPGFINSIWQLRLHIPPDIAQRTARRLSIEGTDPSGLLVSPLGIYVQ